MPVSTIPNLEGLNDEEAVDVIKEWFLSNFEDPVQETPRNDGEFQYISGGPYDARDQIGDAFSDQVSENVIDAAVRAVEAKDTRTGRRTAIECNLISTNRRLHHPIHVRCTPRCRAHR